MIRHALLIIGLLSSIMALAGPLMANDGFYWGSGNTLRPVNNQSLRVQNEQLKITAVEKRSCYEILYHGKALGAEEPKAGEFATLGRRVPCTNEAPRGLFRTEWSAEAVYEVEALADAPDVLFGFPVNAWDVEFNGHDGLEEVPAPGMVEFHTFVDGVEVGHKQLKWLDQAGAPADRKSLGYTWTASFKKGRHYRLRTVYDFGVDSTNGFYEGSDFLKGEPPWFIAGGMMPSYQMIYILTPLKQWAAPPPASVSIVVTMPTKVPTLFAVPLELKPVCVGEHSLFYEMKDTVPAQDLKVSYPSSEDLPSAKLEKPEDWEKWLKTLGGAQVEMNCALLARLKKEAGPQLQSILKAKQCRPSCAAAPVPR